MALDAIQGTGLRTLLDRQKAAHLRDGAPSLARRIEWLDKSIDLLATHGDALNDAMCSDFGHRSKDQSNLTDIAGSIGALKHAKAHVAKWMKPEKRTPFMPMNFLGAKAHVHYQPKGVVGIMTPWNVPVNMIFSPLADVLGAGNRAMPKRHRPAEASSPMLMKKTSAGEGKGSQSV